MMKATKTGLLLLLTGFTLFVFSGAIFSQSRNAEKQEKAVVESYVQSSSQQVNEQAGNSELFSIIKYEEVFPDTFPPSDWQSVNADGSPSPDTSWEYYQGINFTSGDSVRPHAGAAFWANNFNNANGLIIADWLLSPRLPVLEAGDSLYVYVNAIGGTYPDTLTVWVSITDSAVLNFDTQIGTIVDPGPTGEWHLYAIDITFGGLFVGFEPFVGFKHDHMNGGPTGVGSNWVHLDHVILANGGLSSVDPAEGNVPSDFALKQNFPNPFNPTTTISYDLKKSADVTLTVYNLAGQEVKTLVSGKISAGSHQISWDGTNSNGTRVASGIYLYRLQAGDFVQTRKMVLLK